MAAICAKYGLQGQLFATLPTFKTYHLLKQKSHEIITLDIRKELQLLAVQPTYRLQITVPTTGFTDPLLDNQAIPRFAIPLSINGFIADENNTHAAKAASWGTDIADNSYPLLRNHRGKIDYSLIYQTQPNSSLFTTLRAISYLFQAQQAEGQGLLSSELAALTGMVELLLFYPSHAPLTLILDVLNQQGEKVHTRQIGYFPQPITVPKASYRLQRHIVGEITAAKMMQYYRSKWTFEVQITNETLRMTQFAGLSYHALKMLLKQLLPLSHFFMVFTRHHGQRSENRYIDFPQYQKVFYEHVIESILDQSLPLMSLQDYFTSQTYDLNRLAKTCQTWDEHDKEIAKQILDQPSLEALVDLIDEFIALRDSVYAVSLELPAELLGQVAEIIQVECALEDKEGQWITLPVTHPTMIPDTFSVYASVMSAKTQHLDEANLRGLRRK